MKIQLKKSIDAIKCIRLELHNKVEDSVIRQLDEVIFELENLLSQKKLPLDKSDMLLILSKAIEQLPTIANVLDDLFNGK